MPPSTRRWILYATVAAAAALCTLAYLWLPRPVPLRVSQEDADAEQLRTAAELYRAQQGRCPTVAQVRTWLDRSVRLNTNDGWGTAFRLSCSSDGAVVVMSAGPDRRFGSADDLSTGNEGAWPGP